MNFRKERSHYESLTVENANIEESPESFRIPNLNILRWISKYAKIPKILLYNCDKLIYQQ